MKKLLLLIKLLCFALLISFCKNSNIPKTSETNKTKIQNLPVSTDSKSTKMYTNLSDTVNGGKGIKKDSLIKKNKKSQAIIHNGPDQAKIDSIKNLKTNNKQ